MRSGESMEQYRSKGRLWSWIRANKRLEIELMIVVGREDIGDRHQLLEGISLAIKRALPRDIYNQRREMLLGERYANGFLVTPCVWSGRFEPAAPTTAPIPMSNISYLHSCAVRGPGSGKRAVAQYDNWRRCIIRELSLEYGPLFVNSVADGAPPAPLGDDLAAVPPTAEEEESCRQMFAELVSCGGEDSDW